MYPVRLRYFEGLCRNGFVKRAFVRQKEHIESKEGSGTMRRPHRSRCCSRRSVVLIEGILEKMIQRPLCKKKIRLPSIAPIAPSAELGRDEIKTWNETRNGEKCIPLCRISGTGRHSLARTRRAAPVVSTGTVDERRGGGADETNCV